MLTDISTQYNFNNLFTNKNKKIDFNIYYDNNKESSHFCNYIIEAVVDNQIAGHISILYLSDENKKKYFNTIIDYYLLLKLPNLKNLYHSNETNFYEKFNSLFKLNISNKNEFTHYLNSNFTKQYLNFLSSYLNKPYVEMISVYDENTFTRKDFTQDPIQYVKRDNINFQKLGIASTLYEVSSKILNEHQLYIHNSKCQTKEGEHLWKSFEKNNKFTVLTQSHKEYLSNLDTHYSMINRKKLLLNNDKLNILLTI